MPDPSAVTWFPSWVDRAHLRSFDLFAPDRPDLAHRGERPEPARWPAVAEGLRAARSRLAGLPVAAIIDVIDRVCTQWTDREFPHRLAARRRIVAATGFSPEAVDRSLDVELANYRRATLYATLRRELGDPAVLDRFRPDPELAGRTRAHGPEITGVILTGNVPGLPALPIIRALLVKSAVIAKVASGEPAFAAAFVASLAEVAPALADAVVVTYWRRDDHGSLDAVLGVADAVIAYGGAEACRAIRARLRPEHRYVEHPHTFSAGVLTQRYLAERGLAGTAAAVARDVATFNQHACIAPQAYLVEEGEHSPRRFAEVLAAAMAADAEGHPLGELSDRAAAAAALQRTADVWRAATDESSWSTWTSAGFDWTVVLAPDLPESGGGNRVIRVVPVRTAGAAVDLLRPVGARLQNIGLGATGAQFRELAERFAAAGASRICEPGRMAEPSMMWRHDGMPCVAGLVRWCDIEMHQESRASEEDDDGPDRPDSARVSEASRHRRSDRLHAARR
ncbi:MAG TPA: acyl-CoA reductase [Actinophytocola sp.]|uniref:acyl-CoA reductase n=1 Tax=Actinophytocola sp. TaxID=1872138 RepID=UPI002DF8200F|nr:acyl-CoA reductase [Actinophytocola sp.]